MTGQPISERAGRHVAACNESVQSGEWEDFAGRFAPDATMRFVGVPAGPFTGREAIAAGEAAQSPSDTLTVTRGETPGDVDELWFCWDSNSATGTMVARWSGDLGTELTITFG
jgi:steroid Delta-isomerase